VEVIVNIGCPNEVKNHEYRVGLTPASVHAYVDHGHTVYIQKGAGQGSDIADEEYIQAGAVILGTADDVWAQSDMIVKVKEPIPAEYPFMRPEQLIFTYFHFAASKTLTDACMAAKITALAYETVQEDNGLLPLLKPMSEVAGRMAPIMGAFYLGRPKGGRGVLATGVPGVLPANVAILGGGTVGANAARVAAGLGAKVTILDINHTTLEHLDNIMPANVFSVYSDHINIQKTLESADLVIGAVLIPGAKAPKLITKASLRTMRPGAVIVDVAIDQGGCAETSVPTTHDNPVFDEEGIIHYCVANMPGAYARTSTFALNNATISYGLQLADKGVERACSESRPLLRGLNIYKGTLTCDPVAEAFSMQKVCVHAEDIF
jgi:alanine dehydrogenase